MGRAPSLRAYAFARSPFSLHARGIEARLFLVGGAAMALAYSRDRVTRDLDAVFEPKREVYDEAASGGQ